MVVADLFSGIGGFSLGLEAAGMQTWVFCDIEENCRKILAKNFKDVYIFDDIKKLKIQENDTLADHKDGSLVLKSDIDVLCGGFPCQDISVAGNKKGLRSEETILQVFEREFEELFQNNRGKFRRPPKGDLSTLCDRVGKAAARTKARETRSGLWKEYLRLIKEIEPRYALVENVANLRNEGLVEIIQDLWKVGYACEWHIISARSVGSNGDHLRERLWIVAYPNGERCLQHEGQSQKIQQGRDERLQREKGEQHRLPKSLHSGNEVQLPNADMPRLWKPFASEKEKSEWWAKTTASVSCGWQAEPELRRVDDGLPKELDKDRKERIKMLGNSVVPQIPEIIGKLILEWENNNLRPVK